ncbi:hypothetical protein C8P66_103206 [Humitalea rosea]|uniref:Uncharacterized protein n=1 Tax=Humitalea rosea TaxID=990373 RepID=A0A2W7ISE4_9PROT|nr:hypothetical protein [Humitalea rosea]PZW49180.1 hypothetical protein C8P66_103206 [Humitalea rosea]
MARFTLRSLTAAAAVAVALAAPFAAAQAEEVSVSYPRTIGSGESQMIDYGPGAQGNVVGGGAVATSGTGENAKITYFDQSVVQQPRPGLVPVTIGSGEDSETVWVPAGMHPSVVALLGASSGNPG